MKNGMVSKKKKKSERNILGVQMTMHIIWALSLLSPCPIHAVSPSSSPDDVVVVVVVVVVGACGHCCCCCCAWLVRLCNRYHGT